jgi:hypothetical protein
METLDETYGVAEDWEATWAGSKHPRSSAAGTCEAGGSR